MTRLDEIREVHAYPTADLMALRGQWADESIDYLLDLVERAKAILGGERVHAYMGGCPSPEDWTARDSECPACRWLRDVEGVTE